MTKYENESDLLEAIDVLDFENDNQRNSVVCSLIGHSKIQDTFFGYFYCSRCGSQTGDQLASYYDASEIVIVNHDCEKCHENYKKLTWKDKLFVDNPFGEDNAPKQ